MPPMPPAGIAGAFSSAASCKPSRTVRRHSPGTTPKFEQTTHHNHTLARAEQRSDAAGVNKRRLDDLERVKDTRVDHVRVLALGGIVAPVELVGVLVQKSADHNAALLACVLDDCPSRSGKCVLDDRNTELLVKVGALEVLEADAGLEQGSATTRNCPGMRER
jgi:hypothetical protein